MYTMQGDLDRVRVPAPLPRTFVDGLWRGTCFEAFVAAGEGYDEFNLAPSGAFAAYRFSGYRAGMARLEGELPVAWSRGRLETMVPVREDARRLALAAVIEEADGALSYWALRHAPGKPDFHHPDAFALDLDEMRH
ncbi:MAG TPA: DOMON-like domain-containing protein [Burkholderiales bacterium]|nr:DOMON-like domain-containing protein [Burkholderiales bacterium]